MKTALVLDNFKNIEPARGFILLFLAIVLSLKNEKDCLPSHISEILVIGEKYEYEYLSANGRRLAAFERYLSLDAEASVEMLDYAVYYYRRMSNKVMAQHADCFVVFGPYGPTVRRRILTKPERISQSSGRHVPA